MDNLKPGTEVKVHFNGTVKYNFEKIVVISAKDPNNVPYDINVPAEFATPIEPPKPEFEEGALYSFYPGNSTLYARESDGFRNVSSGTWFSEKNTNDSWLRGLTKRYRPVEKNS